MTVTHEMVTVVAVTVVMKSAAMVLSILQQSQDLEKLVTMETRSAAMVAVIFAKLKAAVTESLTAPKSVMTEILPEETDAATLAELKNAVTA